MKSSGGRKNNKGKIDVEFELKGFPGQLEQRLERKVDPSLRPERHRQPEIT